MTLEYWNTRRRSYSWSHDWNVESAGGFAYTQTVEWTGWLHYREGFRPWTEASPPPIQRLSPWNTRRERQSLVRFPMLSSRECDFMSKRTQRSDCRRQ